MKLKTTYQTVLGRLIASRRRQKQMDQGELARHVGVNRSTWSRIEAGLSALSIDQLAKAASALGVSVSQLTTEADEVVRGLRQEDVEVHSSRNQARYNAAIGAASGGPVGTTGVFLRGDMLTAMVASIMGSKKGRITMGYEYRQDEGLDFLEGVSSEDLDGLVTFLTGQRNEELTDSERYKLYHPDHSKYWREIATEIQTFGGNTISNFYRGEGTYYRDILYDVCDRLKVNYNKAASIPTIELNLLQKALADTFEKLEPEQRAEVLKALGKDNASNLFGPAAVAAAQALLRASGFAAYKWALILVNGALKRTIGMGLSFAANQALVRSLSAVIGPVGWALTAAWTIYDFSGPAYRVTVPSVIYIATLRLKQLYGEHPEDNPVSLTK